MTRSIIVIVSVFCVATILSQVLGLCVLWYRDQLTAETIKDIRDILSGQHHDVLADVEDEDKMQLSNEAVVRERAFGILSLNARDNELLTLKSMLDAHAEQLMAEQAEFGKRKKAFEDELQSTKEEIASAAAEQARGVLLKLPDKDAVDSLMQLDLEQNVVLLKEMPEKEIARILQQFFASADDDQLERGHQIFNAISRGEPLRTVADEGVSVAAP